MVVMGIDWNKTAGSEYVVIAFDLHHKTWWVIDASNISYEKFMETRAQLIGEYYMKFHDEDMQLLSHLDYEKDDEPPGLFGMILRVIKKIF